MSDLRNDLDATWGEVWRSSPPVEAPPIGRVRRRSYGYLAWVGGQWLLGVAGVVLATRWAVADLHSTSIVAATAVACFVAAALVFDAWNRRGTFLAVDRSVRAWLELAERRLVAELRALRFGWGLLAAEAAFFVPWLAWGLEERGASFADYLEAYGFLAAMLTAFAAAIAWFTRRERRKLVAIREQLAGYEEP